MRKKSIFIAILLLATLSLFSLGSNFKQEQTNHISVTPIQNSVSYKGEEGKDALVLLKQKYSVTQGASGLVVGINGKKADSKNREYWAFYVNGKMANVGSSDYETKNEDLIEWKIEKY